MTNLVYLSPVPWESFAQRPHRFVTWFRRRTGGSVLWIDPYPTRLPYWSDLRLSKSRASHAGPDLKIPDWLRVLKLPSLPLEPIPGSAWLNRVLWSGGLRKIRHYSKKQETLLVIGKPSIFAFEVLTTAQHCLSLYDAMDDFSAFYSGLSRISMLRQEHRILGSVDLVWVSSSGLKSRHLASRKDVRIVFNAVDSSTMKSGEIKNHLDARKQDTKIFGYIGTIGFWFDWDWIIELARARPKDLVQIVGPLYSMPKIQLPRNIEILPPCAHEQALLYMAKFDIGLIPFKLNTLTAGVDPIKYYEYRALGLPIVSTNFGEMSLRNDEPGIFLSKAPNDINELIMSAINYKSEEKLNNSFVSANTWDGRFDSSGLMELFSRSVS